MSNAAVVGVISRVSLFLESTAPIDRSRYVIWRAVIELAVNVRAIRSVVAVRGVVHATT